MSDKSTFYLVREEILPEAIKKTIKVKEILKRGEIKTINEAVEKMHPLPADARCNRPHHTDNRGPRPAGSFR